MLATSAVLDAPTKDLIIDSVVRKLVPDTKEAAVIRKLLRKVLLKGVSIEDATRGSVLAVGTLKDRVEAVLIEMDRTAKEPSDGFLLIVLKVLLIICIMIASTPMRPVHAANEDKRKKEKDHPHYERVTRAGDAIDAALPSPPRGKTQRLVLVHLFAILGSSTENRFTLGLEAQKHENDT